MAFVLPAFIVVVVLLAAPQIAIGVVIVGVGAGLSAAAGKLIVGGEFTRR